jgi:NAD(P)-dependent dehydrogenase (short-subunit alcohol dehydrogenase family)
MKLAGKVAILTGAAGGIGSAIALQMAREGARVVLGDVQEETLRACVARLKSDGHTVTGFCSDISTAAGNDGLVRHALDAFGQVDVFHANAGVARFEDLLEATPESIGRTLEINLNGAIHGCAAVLPGMVRRRSGVILLTASVAAFVGDPTIPVYSASKGGLTALCRSVAVRHGPEGIRCVTICPGDVRTPMLEAYLARCAEPSKSQRELIERYPLRRLAEPIDIARAAVFLASEDAAWITGTDLIIDGGLTARCY